MRAAVEACDNSLPYQPAPTPTWSKDKWPLGSPPNDDDLYGTRYTFQTVSHLPHPAALDKDIKPVKSWREFTYSLLAKEKPLDEAKKKATHLVLHPYKSFNACTCCNLAS